MKTAKKNCKNDDDEMTYDYLLRAKVITTLRSTYYEHNENYYYFDDTCFIKIHRNPTIESFLNLDETTTDFSPARIKISENNWIELMRLYNGTIVNKSSRCC